jgi:SAM-dependent methyltransferase
MIDTATLDAASAKCLGMGIKVLQGFRLADTDEGHIAALLAYMAPERGTRWIDIGCGFGEPARLMQAARPDLNFTLVNDNQFQLDQTPSNMAAFLADMHALPFDAGEFDGAMFLYSLCHAGFDALHEAGRVVKNGGRLFVFDYLRLSETKKLRQLTKDTLGARFWSLEDYLGCAWSLGWRDCRMAFPDGSDAVFRAAFGEQGQPLYQEIFRHLIPVIFTATAL